MRVRCRTGALSARRATCAFRAGPLSNRGGAFGPPRRTIAPPLQARSRAEGLAACIRELQPSARGRLRLVAPHYRPSLANPQPSGGACDEHPREAALRQGAAAGCRAARAFHAGPLPNRGRFRPVAPLLDGSACRRRPFRRIFPDLFSRFEINPYICALNSPKRRAFLINLYKILKHNGC